MIFHRITPSITLDWTSALCFRVTWLKRNFTSLADPRILTESSGFAQHVPRGVVNCPIRPIDLPRIDAKYWIYEEAPKEERPGGRFWTGKTHRANWQSVRPGRLEEQRMESKWFVSFVWKKIMYIAHQIFVQPIPRKMTLKPIGLGTRKIFYFWVFVDFCRWQN